MEFDDDGGGSSATIIVVARRAGFGTRRSIGCAGGLTVQQLVDLLFREQGFNVFWQPVNSCSTT